MSGGKPVNYGKFASFTRGDLIRTIEKLLERETALLNRISALQPKTPWGNDGEGGHSVGSDDAAT